ncbi:MAG: ATP synthase F0 subunit B [Desulfovibrionaceae bacterium]
MVIPDKSIFIQFVNFVLTIVVLNALLFNPIRGIIKKRKELMAGQLESIEKFNEQAAVKVKDYEKALDVARKQAVEVRTEMRQVGVTEEQKILSAAGVQAAKTLKDAQADISKQVSAAMTQLAKEVDGFAQKAADKILG